MKTSLRVLMAGLLLSLAGAPAGAADGVYASPGPWVDDAEHVFELRSLAGSYTVVTMAYGACQRVCSTTVRVLQSVHALARARQVPLRFVVFGLDPSQDTPADWAAFRTQRGLVDAEFTFLAGPPSAVRQVAARLGVHYWRYGDHILHDFRVLLLSPDGTVLRSIDRFDEDPALLLPPPAP